MDKLTQKQQNILQIFIANGKMQSSQVHKEIVRGGEDVSLVTTKRALSEMAKQGLLEIAGSGRSTIYNISSNGRIFANIDPTKYTAIEPDKRYGLHSYNFNLFDNFPSDIFTNEELQELKDSTNEYNKRTSNLPVTIQKKELERLVIELSWKSSKIEGNTYTLLDTEKLILENKEAPGKSKTETQMILNHKDAFNFIHKYPLQFKDLSKKNLEELHSLIIKNLNINSGFRQKPVGVVGSIYRPLDNIYQITEAVENLSKTMLQSKTAFAKALLALVGISYIQPFEDGNKRTSRLMANGLLVANGLAPLSYRSINEEEYRSAMLVFYEVNSIVPMKKIFIEQYKFAAENYAAK